MWVCVFIFTLFARWFERNSENHSDIIKKKKMFNNKKNNQKTKQTRKVVNKSKHGKTIALNKRRITVIQCSKNIRNRKVAFCFVFLIFFFFFLFYCCNKPNAGSDSMHITFRWRKQITYIAFSITIIFIVILLFVGDSFFFQFVFYWFAENEK